MKRKGIATYEHGNMKDKEGGLSKRAVDFVVKRLKRIHTPNLAVYTCTWLMEHEKEVGLIFWNTRKEKDARQHA
jgi:hypothetical protein